MYFIKKHLLISPRMGLLQKHTTLAQNYLQSCPAARQSMRRFVQHLSLHRILSPSIPPPPWSAITCRETVIQTKVGEAWLNKIQCEWYQEQISLFKRLMRTMGCSCFFNPTSTFKVTNLNVLKCLYLFLVPMVSKTGVFTSEWPTHYLSRMNLVIQVTAWTLK